MYVCENLRLAYEFIFQINICMCVVYVRMCNMAWKTPPIIYACIAWRPNSYLEVALGCYVEQAWYVSYVCMWAMVWSTKTIFMFLKSRGNALLNCKNRKRFYVDTSLASTYIYACILAYSVYACMHGLYVCVQICAFTCASAHARNYK
jgi:hypothetical protein